MFSRRLILLVAILSGICLWPLVSLAQFKITGRVVDIFTKQPIPKATVFLSNATNGTASDDAGNFTLTNVKRGQYDLVVTSIGYVTYHQSVIISNDLNTGNLMLEQKNTELQTVTIKPDPNRENYLNEFKQDFIGNSSYAEKCRIQNLDVLNISYDNHTHQLTANADTYLDIVNEALGYRIKYYLNQFIKDRDSNYVFYQGSSVFEDLKGSKRQLKRWAKRRQEVYYGSLMHFLRSCIGNNAGDEGFKMLRLVIKPNTSRQPEKLIQAKLAHFRAIKQYDSLRYWANEASVPKNFQYLIHTPLQVEDFVKRTDRQGLYAFGLNDHLYIMYTKKGNDAASQPSYHPLDAPDYLTSIATFKKPYVFFDDNGIIVDPFDAVFEGYWSNDRISRLLPVNYEPNTKSQ